MTTSLGLLGMVRTACIGNTNAGANVYGPGDWPSQIPLMPLLKLRLLAEDRQVQSMSGPAEFNTTATFRIIGEVQAAASENDAGAAVAEAAAGALKSQVDVAVINSYPLMQNIQQILSVRTQFVFNSDGAQHLASFEMDITVKFFESAEDFAQVASTEITGADIQALNYPPAQNTISLD